MKKARVLSYPLSAQLAHSHFVCFVMLWLICIFTLFRSRPGVYRVSEGVDADARRSFLVCDVLSHGHSAGTGQRGITASILVLYFSLCGLVTS